MIYPETEVRAEIARQNLKIIQLASLTGLKREYLSARLNGHKELTVNELHSIGRVLGIPAWELLRRAEESQSALAGSGIEKALEESK
ncbi:helix-turn-helix domain-containing protein [Schaalia sp. lx-260]|uniref:helix-turn-helix domain-containing protein n=1 Tax=Schaalia sp. lx-260 TaxID=2899082 RepID=UPI001E4FF694|nr:helix-turn-helix transcriptional regulator [Schaalia sp. lx-260]MCD4549699.1 helix-turn-helix domain-containing protein [Schaalia sp. lx-260]